MIEADGPEQEALFYKLAPKTFGDAVLVSHAIVGQWDRDNPATLSPAAIGRLRATGELELREDPGVGATIPPDAHSLDADLLGGVAFRRVGR